MMEQWIIKFRNNWDFIIYGIKIRKINPYFLIINLFTLVYSFFQYESFFSEKNIVLLLFLIFINIIWQIFSTIQDGYYYTKQTGYYISQSNKIATQFKLNPEVYDKYRLIKIDTLNSSIIYSDTINDILTSDKPIRIKISRKKTNEIDKYIQTYKEILLPFLNWKWHEIKNHNGSFYNEKKLCMASEIEKHNENEYLVFVNKGCYYNSFLTNNIYNLKMSHQNGLYIEPPLNSQTYPIQALHNSYMSNHIGISTIAVSSDGYAIIMRHNNKTVVSSDKLLPSGSGSMDFADLQESQDFREIIIQAAERELHEETNIDANNIQKTEILGFYRDLNRGGKPEFCCLTYLKPNKLELREIITPSQSEQRDDFKTIKIFDGKEFLSSAWDNSLQDSPKEYSLALYMNYFMLCKYFHSTISLYQEENYPQ